MMLPASRSCPERSAWRRDARRLTCSRRWQSRCA